MGCLVEYAARKCAFVKFIPPRASTISRADEFCHLLFCYVVVIALVVAPFEYNSFKAPK